MTDRHRYYVATIGTACIVLVIVRYFFQPFGLTFEKFDAIRRGMSDREVVLLLGEPTSDRIAEEAGGQRIMTFRGEGASGVVYLDPDGDGCVTAMEWIEDRATWTNAELVWMWLWGLD